MWFIGKLDIGQSLKSLQQRSEKITAQQAALKADVAGAIESRTTVIATIGAEIEALKQL